MAKPPQPESFCVSPGDPLAEEHGLVSAWIEDVRSSLGEHWYYNDVELKVRPTGKKLLDAKPEQSRRLVMAALAQTKHWDAQAELVRGQAETENERVYFQNLPGWQNCWGLRRQTEAVIRTLMRRSLPFERQDLLDLVQWCGGSGHVSTYSSPLGSIVKVVEHYASDRSLDDELLEALKRFARQLRSSHDKDAKRLATKVEQLCADAGETESIEAGPVATTPPPEPAPAGLPGVLEELKTRMGMSGRETNPATNVIGPDQFPLADDSPLKFEHELLSDLFEEVVGTRDYYNPDLKRLDAGRKLLDLQTERLGAAVLAAAERHIHALLAASPDVNEAQVWQSRYTAASVVAPLAQQRFSLPRVGVFDFLLYLASRPVHEHGIIEATLAELISSVEDDARDSPLTEGERYVLSLFRVSRISGPALGAPTDEATRLTQLIGDGACFCLVPGEWWTEAVNRDFTRMDGKQRREWAALFGHALTATSARPSAKWLKTADKLVQDLGGAQVCERLEQWLPLVARGRSVSKLGSYSGDARGAANTMNDENASCLRGLLWLTQALPGADSWFV